ncbi:PAP2 superfamily protein [Trichomonas vaginalis G3]|uniref:PAP2 superfamily protein n=1 Tax=Trichomonas vaginalis (strain ATCC PRA-98 / G3) TaxID=412133 RepID=A2EQG2_TRIV3|nr:phosphatidate phosphatase protein [Trichomonas vaginalis G3]EAY05104.1 PAP2 superfamily protein [Trichomonas vaginalis G3]KAI5551466.1 phosphatidate phosphatase protein [Trichomonas vaginalis G3]|eukprot:XP_001317327.1 PAP2 superfamily protein [Trichomonas vaginalis G3]
MLLVDFFNFLSQYAIIDWIVNILLLVPAYILKYTTFGENFTPFITSDIDNPISTNSLTYGILCIVIFGVGSLIVILLWLLIYYDVNVIKATASYIFSIASAMLVCAAIGKIVGRPRPDTIAICGGDGSYLTCTGFLDQKQLASQFSSFPATEAAEAMAAAIFLCLYIGELIPYYNNVTSLLMASPIFFAIFVVAACIWDRRNHIDDAVCAMIIGAVMGLISFHTFKKVIKQKKIELRPAAVTETSSLPMPRYN